MIMNITTKKQEYGVLQAVGMTNKQLNLCLQLQGLIFTVGTICVALIIGLPLGYALFSYAKHNGIFGMNIYHVPIVPIFIMIFLVGLLQIVLSCVLSSNLKKETLVERIRYQMAIAFFTGCYRCCYSFVHRNRMAYWQYSYY